MKNLLTIILTLAFSISAFAAATPEKKDPQQDEVNVDENNMNKKETKKEEVNVDENNMNKKETKKEEVKK
jgi:hypothetical protein